MDAYKACVVERALALLPNPVDGAYTLAQAAEHQCSDERFEVQDFVMNPKPGKRFSKEEAQPVVNNIRASNINEAALAVLKKRAEGHRLP